MADSFNVGASTIREYVDIVYDVLTNKDKMFNRYISIPIGQPLRDIIAQFDELMGLPNICNSIEGIDMPLFEHPSRKVTLALNDFFNRKRYHSIVVQANCNGDKLF